MRLFGSNGLSNIAMVDPFDQEVMQCIAAFFMPDILGCLQQTRLAREVGGAVLRPHRPKRLGSRLRWFAGVGKPFFNGQRRIARPFVPGAEVKTYVFDARLLQRDESVRGA